MAYNDVAARTEPGTGGGGSGWEEPRRSAGPSLQYDANLGRYVMGYLNSDGSVSPASAGAPGGSFIRDAVNSVEQRAYGGGMPGGGGGAPGGSFVRNAIKQVAQNAGGDGGTDWMRVLAPLLGLGATAVKGGFNTPNAGMDPGIQKQIEALIARQNLRGEKSEPIYDAAMQLAGNLAPTSQNNPRLQEAIRDAGSPMPQRQMDPQVAEAYARLMGGR